MSSRHPETGTLALLAGALAAGLIVAACSSDVTPTGLPTDAGAAAVSASTTTGFGPFPGRTTVFVDVDNTTGVEDGSQTHPFNRLSEGLAAARSGDAVGLAPGVYAEVFGPDLRPNYVIQGRRSFKLIGMGPGKTIIRGDHSFSLIRVQNGASGLIEGMTIERGGRLPNSEGGGLQVLGITDSVSLTVSHVILQDNWAVNGGAIAVDGRVNIRLVDVLVANNVASNCCGGVYLEGVNGPVRATFKNVTITSNSANFHTGGVLLVGDTRLDLLNSIVWHNDLAEVTRYNGIERLHTTYSDVGETLLPGTGNISADPKFFAPGDRDYRLLGRSPAVDAGTNAGAPTTDIRGLARPLDGNGDGIAVTDMGAYEFGKIFTTP
jgi:hypothetical protein